MKDFFKAVGNALARTTLWQRLFYALFLACSISAFVRDEYMEAWLWLLVLMGTFNNNWSDQIIDSYKKTTHDLLDLTKTLLKVNQDTVAYYTGEPVRLEKDDEL